MESLASRDTCPPYLIYKLDTDLLPFDSLKCRVRHTPPTFTHHGPN